MRTLRSGFFRRALPPLWAFLAALSLCACRGAVERMRRAVHLEAPAEVVRLGSAGASVTLRLRNDSPRTLRLETGRFELFLDGASVAEFRLHEPVEIPARATSECRSLWRLRSEDPMACYALERKLRDGEVARIGVSALFEGRCGRYPVKFSCERMPVSDFLNTFGLSIKDLENLLE